MTTKSGELLQGNGGAPLPSPDSQPQPQPQPGPPEHLLSRSGDSTKIFKSGPLFISSKGIGWTSWKKRWFVLTQTSLVFFRNDPNAVSQRGNEVNLTLGGIDLNNSGSVIVKADKKLLTVQFPDVRDGRAFTLKAETTEDLYEWKTALENALAQAPSAADVMGQNGIFKNDQSDSLDSSSDQLKDREPMKSTVIGRPILLALEDADGTPSFLEKAMRFIEEHGVKVEGILRQAADVEHVEHRVREYEQGKVEFSQMEDAHVIGDCIKHVLREMPSAPIPASCCKALLEACRTARVNRVSAMRAAICETFPEPNRHLLQRILLMMQAVASFKAVNRMSSSAVAACMAPLLLRPLLAGECEIEHDFDVGGDGSAQLLQAAAAANHAQAIVITLLEEYDSIFGEGSMSPGPDMYTDSDESESGSEEATDDDYSYDDDDYDDEQDESMQESEVDAEDDLGSETSSEAGDSVVNNGYDDKDHDISCSTSKSSEVGENLEADRMLSSNTVEVSMPQHEDIKSCENITNKTACADEPNKPADVIGGFSTDQPTMNESNCPNPSYMKKSISISNGPAPQRRTVLGRTSARKNLSMESIQFFDEDEAEIERLETVKTELQNRIAEEAKANAKLQSQMEKRKEALQERSLALERDVARLREQLQKEKSFRATLEAGLKSPPGPLSDLSSIDEKAKADLEELVLVEEDLADLERKVDELGVRLSGQLGRKYGSMLDSCNQPQQISNNERNLKNKPDTEVAVTSQSERSIIKDTDFGGAENENERKPESKPLPNKQPSSKKYGTRSEQGADSATTALTKLTSRLNFLKDRRELNHSSQNLEKGKGGDLHPPLPSPKKSRGFDFYLPLTSPSKSRGYDFHLPLLSPNRSRGSEGPQHPDKLRKSDSQPGHLSDRQNQYPQYLRRGRSEGHHQPCNLDNVQ